VWLLWAIAAGASVQLAPNPLYVTVVVALAALAALVATKVNSAWLVGAGVVVGAVHAFAA
jgi:hypothetical protein